MWAYWVHNGRRWVCVGTVRAYAAFMLRLARELPRDVELPHRGRAAVTRATASGVVGQENVPAPLEGSHMTYLNTYPRVGLIDNPATCPLDRV